ncbi:hypothetical protein evm_015250, partial [Chilo suppressalis]
IQRLQVMDLTSAASDYGCYKSKCWSSRGCWWGWCYTVNPKNENDFATCTTDSDCNPEWPCPEEESCFWPHLL